MDLMQTNSQPISIYLTGVLSYLLGKRKCEISISSDISYSQLMEALSVEVGKPLFLETRDNHWILRILENPPVTFSITIILNGSRWIPGASEDKRIPPGVTIQMLAPIGGG